MYTTVARAIACWLFCPPRARQRASGDGRPRRSYGHKAFSANPNGKNLEKATKNPMTPYFYEVRSS